MDILVNFFRTLSKYKENPQNSRITLSGATNANCPFLNHLEIFLHHDVIKYMLKCWKFAVAQLEPNIYSVTLTTCKMYEFEQLANLWRLEDTLAKYITLVSGLQFENSAKRDTRPLKGRDLNHKCSLGVIQKTIY